MLTLPGAICDDAGRLPEATVARNPEIIDDNEVCIARIIAHARGDLRVAAPLGLGKPNLLLNALYAHAVRYESFKLTLYTALSLARPKAHNDLERRFLDPFLARHFGADYPDLAYVSAQHAGSLPPNVRVHEFYLQSGAMIGVAQSQRDYISMNYTHVARDVVGAGINAIVQLIAVRDVGSQRRYSLACNPDVTADLLDRIAAAGSPRPLVVGVVHADLPFIGNDAEVGAEFFDVVLDDESNRHTLFALPRDVVDVPEFAIGLHASTLVRDGGTLQIGIGALSDALVHATLLRHTNNSDYRIALAALGASASDAPAELAERIGGVAPFVRGMYGASELVMDGFMHLAQAGVLSRRVYDDHAIERALACGVIAETLSAAPADDLYEHGILPPLIDARAIARLQRFGLLPTDAVWRDSDVLLADGTHLPTDLRDAADRASWNRLLGGRRLRDGHYLRGAFYLGSKDFYAWLRGLQGEAFEGLSMTRVSDINQLYGGRESLDALQRRDARFFNICMMATLFGAAVSDGLDNGQVVSGVGGQYNFVAMAHALDGGRSILMLRSTRTSAGTTASNILWNYGATTIPRHLRDIYVTEYGIADLRGKSDEDCIIAMLSLSDARFQGELARKAIAAGKLSSDFRAPEAWRRNTRENLEQALAPLKARGVFPDFPFGSDFSATEQRLLPALQLLQRVSTHKTRLAAFLLKSLVVRSLPTDGAESLDRLGLSRPLDVNSWILRKIVLRALWLTQ